MGANGENLFQCIESFSDYLIDGRLKHENSEGDTLLYNLRGWLSVVSPGIEFRYQLNKTSDSSYSTFDDHRATNVGFGLSYALPVITSLLIGSLIPNSLVIIENPEAHLHPKGQTEIARLISLCAQTGTQIIVETHSDHIFDGIRISVKNSGFAEKVQIHWFELDSNKNTEVYSPTLHNDGRIDEWPRGFFDQFEINASKLL
jgi:predicted ATPase